jgi:Ca-activated chloride channel family protein
MKSHTRTAGIVIASLIGTMTVADAQSPSRPQQGDGDKFRFRTGVELINVTATVTDANGRYISGLRKDDFIVYEDDAEQAITHFSAERVPVSLGIAIDTSGSMAGEKFGHAQDALDRFLYDLLAEDDEVFLYRFSNDPVLEQGWTTDRSRIAGALRRITPRGGTSMYDAVAEAVPLAQTGRNRKKALVVISDGNDTNSQTDVAEVKQLIRETEVLVYAVGIDGESRGSSNGGWTSRPPVQLPWPFPGTRRGPSWPGPSQPGGSGRSVGRSDDRVNIGALREMTDDSGGRTEIVRTSRDLGPATANIADELSQQYFFAYPAGARRDGRWHSIRVETRDGRYRVRARRGYIAS